ncbi:hypothetical protein IWZ00DRAFT_331593 [Phyllosticta capitalensis]
MDRSFAQSLLDLKSINGWEQKSLLWQIPPKWNPIDIRSIDRISRRAGCHGAFHVQYSNQTFAFQSPQPLLLACPNSVETLQLPTRGLLRHVPKDKRVSFAAMCAAPTAQVCRSNAVLAFWILRNSELWRRTRKYPTVQPPTLLPEDVVRMHRLWNRVLVRPRWIGILIQQTQSFVRAVSVCPCQLKNVDGVRGDICSAERKHHLHRAHAT